jgi:hypothetical protein
MLKKKTEISLLQLVPVFSAAGMLALQRFTAALQC